MKTKAEFFIGKDGLTYWNVKQDGKIKWCSDQGYPPEEARKNFNDGFLTPWRLAEDDERVWLNFEYDELWIIYHAMAQLKKDNPVENLPTPQLDALLEKLYGYLF